jgi:hypothetical protein
LYRNDGSRFYERDCCVEWKCSERREAERCTRSIHRNRDSDTRRIDRNRYGINYRKGTYD